MHGQESGVSLTAWSRGAVLKTVGADTLGSKLPRLEIDQTRRSRYATATPYEQRLRKVGRSILKEGL